MNDVDAYSETQLKNFLRSVNLNKKINEIGSRKTRQSHWSNVANANMQKSNKETLNSIESIIIDSSSAKENGSGIAEPGAMSNDLKIEWKDENERSAYSGRHGSDKPTAQIYEELLNKEDDSSVEWEDGDDRSTDSNSRDNYKYETVPTNDEDKETKANTIYNTMNSCEVGIDIAPQKEQQNEHVSQSAHYALLQAQETAANLTNWAGRAVRLAIEDHLVISGGGVPSKHTGIKPILKNDDASLSEDEAIEHSQPNTEPNKINETGSSVHSYMIKDYSLSNATIQHNTNDLVGHREDSDAFVHKNRVQQRDSDMSMDEMKEDIIHLLELFGLPYVVAPAEAEAQCVTLETLGLVNGVVTEDSDAIVFGAKKVYKNIFDDKVGRLSKLSTSYSQ